MKLRRRSIVVEGRLEAVLDGYVRGWAWIPSDPGTRVPVRIAVDGAVVASGVADLFWPRLQSAGLGDGAHGFEVMVPPRLSDRGTHSLCVLAGPDDAPLSVDPEFVVETGPWFAKTKFTPAAALPEPPPAPAGPST